MGNEKNGRKKNMLLKQIIIIEAVLLVVLAIVFLTIQRSKGVDSEEATIPKITSIPGNENGGQSSLTGNGKDVQTGDNGRVDETGTEKEEQLKQEQEEAERQKQEEERAVQAEIEGILLQADALAAGYDYASAIGLLKGYEGYPAVSQLEEAVKGYETMQAECDPFGAYESSAEVSHVFVHSLIVDTDKAFDRDYDANGYNYYMTTVSEFIEMMQQLYDQGYVLVSIHDVAGQVVLEDGTVTYQDGPIMLPKDKKPFVLSQDDVNYYDYMDEDGFARRMVLDIDGKPTTEMYLPDGSTVIGDFDMVPVIETFLETHPGFSYKGARGIIALTGYEGSLGYRTDPASSDSETYEEDKETVRQIAAAMRELGWEFACHSNGHRDLAACTDSFLAYDTDQWLTHVGSLVGETDIYIYPYGIEIEQTLGPYTNNKYHTLYDAGFRYFCNVDSRPWIQVRKDYVRMGRRPIDGQAMLMYPERLKDLFDLSTIIDPARPELQ